VAVAGGGGPLHGTAAAAEGTTPASLWESWHTKTFFFSNNRKWSWVRKSNLLFFFFRFAFGEENDNTAWRAFEQWCSVSTYFSKD
jgi:hypothetical protein